MTPRNPRALIRRLIVTTVFLEELFIQAERRNLEVCAAEGEEGHMHEPLPADGVLPYVYADQRAQQTEGPLLEADLTRQALLLSYRRGWQ